MQGNAVIVLDVNSNNKVNGNLYPNVSSGGDCCAACRSDIQVCLLAAMSPVADCRYCLPQSKNHMPELLSIRWDGASPI